MRLGWNMPKDIPYFNFNCGTKSRMGSSACFSHFITVPVLEQLVKNDVAAKAEMIIGHEAEFKQRYLQRQSSLADKNQADVKKDLKRSEKRLAEGIVESALDKVKMIEDMGYDNLVISIKSSDVMMCVKAHELIAEKTDHPLHVGITEAGTIISGNIKSAIGLGLI